MKARTGRKKRIRVLPTEWTYKCTICTKSYKYTQGLSRHFKDCHKSHDGHISAKQFESSAGSNPLTPIENSNSMNIDVKKEPPDNFTPQPLDLDKTDSTKFVDIVVKEEPNSNCQVSIGNGNFKGNFADDIRIQLEIDEKGFLL